MRASERVSERVSGNSETKSLCNSGSGCSVTGLNTRVYIILCGMERYTGAG